jgi:hypothetical protein
MVRRCCGPNARRASCGPLRLPTGVRPSAAQRPRGSIRARGRAEALASPAHQMNLRTCATTSTSLDTPCAVAGRVPAIGGQPAWGGGAGHEERCCAAAPHPVWVVPMPYSPGPTLAMRHVNCSMREAFGHLPVETGVDEGCGNVVHRSTHSLNPQGTPGACSSTHEN